MHGLMQGWPLTVDRIPDHAGEWHGDSEVVTRADASDPWTTERLIPWLLSIVRRAHRLRNEPRTRRSGALAPLRTSQMGDLGR